MVPQLPVLLRLAPGTVARSLPPAATAGTVLPTVPVVPTVPAPAPVVPTVAALPVVMSVPAVVPVVVVVVVVVVVPIVAVGSVVTVVVTTAVVVVVVRVVVQSPAQGLANSALEVTAPVQCVVHQILGGVHDTTECVTERLSLVAGHQTSCGERQRWGKVRPAHRRPLSVIVDRGRSVHQLTP